MDIREFVVSTDAFIRISLIFVYVLVCLISYLWLIPRLAPAAKRLAIGFLAAQILVIAMSLRIQSSSSIERWLWDIKSEWNIPSTLASAQLALVGGVALVTAWPTKARPTWQRLHLAGIGLVFVLLALDEYLTLHEGTPNWERDYTALGAVLVVATALVAAHSPRRTWIWHVCFVTGLAISAAGGILLELLPPICGNFGVLRFDKCLNSFHWEEFLEFLGIWLTLVAVLGQFSEEVSTATPRVCRMLYALPAIWILLLFLNSLGPRLELRLFAQPAAVRFESGVQLRGYRIDSEAEASVLRLYLSARRWKYMGLGYSVHLVDQVNGDSVASRDEWADHQSDFWLLAPNDSPVFRQYMEVKISPGTPVDRALWIVLSLWRRQDDEFVSQRVRSSDHRLLSETQVVLGELVIPAVSVASDGAPVAVFDNGFSLAAVEMPERAEPGQSMTFGFTWRSDAQGQEDYSQFLHFVNEESGSWWNFDQQPLGPRLPTRLWYNGLADVEEWRIPVPADLAPGQYAVYTGLYHMQNQQRIPVSTAAGTPLADARVPLGVLIIE